MLRALLPLVLVFSAPAAHAASLGVSVEQADTASVPPGAQRVHFLTLRFAASCESDVTVTSVRVWHRGLGDRADVERAYAHEGGRRISRAVSFGNRRGDATLRFKSFLVRACGGREITVRGDFSVDAPAASEHRLTLLSSADVGAGDARVTLRLPKASGGVRPAGPSRGTIAVEYPEFTKRVRYGANQVIGRLRLAADGEENHEIHAITLTNDGKARDHDLQHLVLRSSNGSIESAEVPWLDGDSARFVFDPPFILNRNVTKLLDIRADVRAGRSQTIRMIVEEPGDIEALPARGRR